MRNIEFYEHIDKELLETIARYAKDEYIRKNKSSVNNQKSYALLIWFLQFYGKRSSYTDYITDGNDDFSCDLILDGKDKLGNNIFYIVQSKWNNAKNSERQTDTDEIKKALSDFETILQETNSKVQVNEKLRLKLEQLDEHLKNNGEVKFIFLSLANYQGGGEDNINKFVEKYENTSFEIIDINRLKLDFIDRTYKKIKPINPLEKYFNPEEEKIALEIVSHNGRYLKVEKPFEAVTLLLRPKSIYELFERYGFALFFKNVRNPLIQSDFNEEIEKTILENPAYFWYYNNGITAITSILPTIGNRAEKIKITGLQIINGAQTVYAIYRAYKNASLGRREIMDSESFINLRLLKSGGKDFDLNVTRYTNSQNPVNDRDFCANDDVQIRLQNESFNTNIWYEKRRSEFRNVPENVRVVPNYIFANAYLVYQLQDPRSLVEKYFKYDKSYDFIFKKKNEKEKDFYDSIFNKNINFVDLLCSFYVFDIVVKCTYREPEFIDYNFTFNSPIYFQTALFKVAFSKYLFAKYKVEDINVNNYIIKNYEEGAHEILIKTVLFISPTNLEEKDNSVKEKIENTKDIITAIESIKLEK